MIRNFISSVRREFVHRLVALWSCLQNNAAIVALTSAEPECTQHVLALRLGMTPGAVKSRLDRLRKLGVERDVARTRERPVAGGEVSPSAAVRFERCSR